MLEDSGHRKIWKGKKIYLGVLNSVDLIITKLFRGTGLDYEDCLALVHHEDVDLARLDKRYRETAGFDVGQERLTKNLEHFLESLKRSDHRGEKK